MQKKIFYFGMLVCILILSILILSGCAKPPTQEVAQAEKAIAEAKQKEADLYVQDIFTKAEDSLKKAKDLINQKKYKDAKKAAEEATQFAQQAIPLIEQNKAKMKAEVEQMVQDVPKAMDELKMLIVKSIKKKAPEEQKEIQGMIGKLEIDMVNVKDMLQGQKIRQAYDGLKAIKEQVGAQKEKMAAPAEVKTEKK
jgi:F0F1-type ATP synthase membrane subunit b/b'